MRYLLIFVTFFIFSCGDSSDSDESIIETPTSIILTVNKATIDLGGTFIFSVKDNLNNTVTSQSTIYFNNTALLDASHTPSSDGIFSVYAEYQELKSVEINVNVQVEEVLSSLILEVDKSKILLGDSVTLAVKGNEGTDLTNDALYFVNGSQITGNSYAPNERGTDKITATYDIYNSNEINVLIGHKQKVLIEDYTGTWCGWCPRIAWGIELVENETDDAITVAIHRGATDSSSDYYDPFNYAAGALEDYIDLDGYPTAMLNRKTLWTYPEPSNVNQVLGLIESFDQPIVSKYGLGISTNIVGSQLEILISCSILNESLNNEKLVVYILEDDLIYNQSNYTDYYGGVSVITNFEHDSVLRQVFTDLFGDAILGSEFNSTENAYQKTFNVDLSGSIIDNTKLSIVAFIVDTNGNAKNVQKAVVGIDKDFD